MKRKQFGPQNPFASKIANLTWDLVIGSGRAQDMLDGGEPEHPQVDDLEALETLVGRAPSEEEMQIFRDEWKKRLMEAAFP